MRKSPSPSLCFHLSFIEVMFFHLVGEIGPCELMNVFAFFSVTVDLVKENATLILRNAKIDMFRGSMRLAVDRWGRVEVGEPATFTVKEDNNLSLVEYELVNVPEEQ